MEPKTPSSVDRRTFLRSASAAGVGAWATGALPAARAAGRSQNETVVVAVMGLNGRGSALARSFMSSQHAEVGYLCDVDEEVLANRVARSAELQDRAPEGVGDFRRALEDPDVDALAIAAPDHWHTPAALLALEAGKHVYVEKPGSQNPREAELIVEAQRESGLLVQMGNQQRSDERTRTVMQQIHEGLIGRPYYARAWYANTRGPIGRGSAAEVPSRLDYELWQGPAPRRPYKDNLIHYNWHWFWNWGTGEICNNGTHEIDLARWALGLDAPRRVTSAGGRYHFDDDWEALDTQDAGFDFDEGKTIVWQGRSCNGFPIMDRGRGVSIHGTEGTVVLDRSGTMHYDGDNDVVSVAIGATDVDPLDTRGGDGMTDRHIANFLDGIRTGAALNSPIHIGQATTLLCHLGNIAHRVGRSLDIDSQTGHILGDEDALELWTRNYEPGWEPAGLVS